METPILTKALVLSSGGMFGAYQAGAWEILSKSFQPDIVVGASIGCLNAWAIAGGCDPCDLTQRWLRLQDAVQHRWKLPRSPLAGFLDAEQLHASIRDIHQSYKPRVPFGVVLTDLLRMKPVLFTSPAIDWEHLAASCAIFGVLPQMRIGGRVYTDGGLLHPLPLWAACEMGASEIVAINVLPRMPGSVLQGCVRMFRAIAPKAPSAPGDVSVTLLEPSRPLGTPRDSIYWSEANTRAWIQLGREDALAMTRRIGRPACGDSAS